MNIICFFKGHLVDDNYHDCGNPICLRCESHSYYNWKEWKWSVPQMYYRLRNSIRRPIEKCSDCKKTQFIIGKHVGNHDRCLPF